MINWKKYFDQVFVLHYAGYSEIESKMMSELTRIGLDDSILTIHNNISSPFLTILQNNIQCDNYPQKMRQSTFSCAFGHYSILKIAELKNYNKILILEDDNAFLKDISQIEICLDSAIHEISNYDVCLFSHFQSPCVENINDIERYINEMEIAKQNNKMFIPFTRTSAAIASAAAYAVSKKGIICLRGLYEHQLQLADMIFRNIPYGNHGTIDAFHNIVLSQLNRFYCRIPISLQNTAKTSMTGKILDSNFKQIMCMQQQIAEKVGINYNLYNF